MSALSEAEKLRVLIPHWREHNEEHAAEFAEWAEKARLAGRGEVAPDLELAARKMREANRALTAALEKLGGLLERA